MSGAKASQWKRTLGEVPTNPSGDKSVFHSQRSTAQVWLKYCRPPGSNPDCSMGLVPTSRLVGIDRGCSRLTGKSKPDPLPEKVSASRRTNGLTASSVAVPEPVATSQEAAARVAASLEPERCWLVHSIAGCSIAVCLTAASPLGASRASPVQA